MRNDIPLVTHAYHAQLLRIIDGDTYDVEVDLGFRTVVRLPLRLAHVDTPERNTTAGKATINILLNMFGELPTSIVVHTYKPVDKYGRYLADVYAAGVDVGAFLLNAGLATPYEGGTKLSVATNEAVAATQATLSRLDANIDVLEQAVKRGAERGIRGDEGETPLGVG